MLRICTFIRAVLRTSRRLAWVWSALRDAPADGDRPRRQRHRSRREIHRRRFTDASFPSHTVLTFPRFIWRTRAVEYKPVARTTPRTASTRANNLGLCREKSNLTRKIFYGGIVKKLDRNHRETTENIPKGGKRVREFALILTSVDMESGSIYRIFFLIWWLAK